MSEKMPMEGMPQEPEKGGESLNPKQPDEEEFEEEGEFNFYSRDELAARLRAEPDKGKRREIWESAWTPRKLDPQEKAKREKLDQFIEKRFSVLTAEEKAELSKRADNLLASEMSSNPVAHDYDFFEPYTTEKVGKYDFPKHMRRADLLSDPPPYIIEGNEGILFLVRDSEGKKLTLDEIGADTHSNSPKYSFNVMGSWYAKSSQNVYIFKDPDGRQLTLDETISLLDEADRKARQANAATVAPTPEALHVMSDDTMLVIVDPDEQAANKREGLITLGEARDQLMKQLLNPTFTMGADDLPVDNDAAFLKSAMNRIKNLQATPKFDEPNFDKPEKKITHGYYIFSSSLDHRAGFPIPNIEPDRGIALATPEDIKRISKK